MYYAVILGKLALKTDRVTRFILLEVFQNCTNPSERIALLFTFANMTTFVIFDINAIDLFCIFVSSHIAMVNSFQ